MKNSRLAHRALLTLLLIHLQLPATLAVIFDLNGALFTTNTRTVLWHLGPTQLARYWVLYGKSPYYLKNKVYELLNTLAPHDNDTHNLIADDAGIAMPILMQRWLTGVISGQSILHDINTYMIQQHTSDTDILEKDLIYNLAHIMFDPATFIATRSVIWEGIQFARHCKQQGHQTYILSNWDADSFIVLYMLYKDIFDDFDGIMISGTQQDMKPSPALFKKLLALYDLKPEDCIFIDDQRENINAAHALGIKTIVCPSSGYPLKKPDFAAVKQAYNTHITTYMKESHA